MTERQRKIIKAILEVLNGLDGGQSNEPILHAEINLRLTPTASRAEFEDAIKYCDDRNWVTGVPSRYGGRLWNLSDAGQAARLEIK
jgi:hypothetical protein